MDAAVILASNIVNTKYEDIPAEALEMSKKLTLDILATAIAGSTAVGCRELVGLIKEWGGTEESTIIAYGCKVPAPNAAQANATMSHALEYDDTHDVTTLHVSTTVVPTALAMAERKGKLSGKEFLSAVTSGLDLSLRMSGATKPKTGLFYDGWWNTSLYGYFSAAATAGKILGLDEEKMVNAFGIAYEQASGTIQCAFESALTKRMCPGFAARGGTVSALMAERGITGARNSLQGKAGLYTIFFSGGCDLDFLTSDLGKRFEGVNISFKPYPCCRLNHHFIDAALTLMKRHTLKPQDIAEVTAFVGQMVYDFICTPLKVKRKPRTVIDAQFSLPWAVATAIVRGKVLIEDFTAKAIKDATVIGMAHKVTPKLDDDLTGVRMIEPAIVEIRTNDGEVFSERVDFPYGSPQNPVDWEYIADKLRDCSLYAAKPIAKSNLEEVIEMVKHLEESDNVSSIIRLLS